MIHTKLKTYIWWHVSVTPNYAADARHLPSSTRYDARIRDRAAIALLLSSFCASFLVLERGIVSPAPAEQPMQAPLTYITSGGKYMSSVTIYSVAKSSMHREINSSMHYRD